MSALPALPWERPDDRSPLSHRLAADTARAVIERRHPAGTLLTETDLAAAHGASRTPAREAMLRLHSWGLVRLLPKKGAIVSEATPRERRDLLALRAMLEVEAVRTLAADPGRGSGPATGREDGPATGLAADLEAILARQRAALESRDVLDFAGADYAFHARVIQSGGNHVVAELLDTLGPRWARLTYLAVTENPPRLETFLREHEGLTARALAGDAEGFSALVRSHIEYGHFTDGDRP
ncbi:GntR family transcriptional regulator [Nocardiopsis akebiae]|uniref:GntR family transcriptional regulator n=1 Tax=Nocardiopsis akebiae TaxID=2831968 RepID=A0ABX8C3A0_9ACTN|nr:GntR family transcriptional regulator [Nocardiopsis akebiae]QUX27068.1 GntR family transcriptional regulator [Nocardiopsis akebiae]